jgi:hypothetical protein
VLKLLLKPHSDKMKMFKSKSEKRIESFRDNLAQRLNNEAGENCAHQVLWLVHHLEEYLERWLSFAQLENLTVAGTLHNDVFCIVLAATNLIEDRIAKLDRASQFPQEEWKHFRSALGWIQKTPERSELNLITDTFESFLKKLPKTSDGSKLN